MLYTRFIETQKQQFQSDKQFNVELGFNEIDDWGYGYIDSKNLKNFLRKHGFISNCQDTIAIIRRMDLDGDARINKDEFIEGLKPQ